MNETLMIRSDKSLPIASVGVALAGAALPCPDNVFSAPLAGGRDACGLSLAAYPACGKLYGADDLVVAGAAAEVPRQPVPDLMLTRTRVLVQQRLRRDQEPRR